MGNLFALIPEAVAILGRVGVFVRGLLSAVPRGAATVAQRTGEAVAVDLAVDAAKSQIEAFGTPPLEGVDDVRRAILVPPGLEKALDDLGALIQRADDLRTQLPDADEGLLFGGEGISVGDPKRKERITQQLAATEAARQALDEQLSPELEKFARRGLAEGARVSQRDVPTLLQTLNATAKEINGKVGEIATGLREAGIVAAGAGEAGAMAEGAAPSSEAVPRPQAAMLPSAEEIGAREAALRALAPALAEIEAPLAAVVQGLGGVDTALDRNAAAWQQWDGQVRATAKLTVDGIEQELNRRLAEVMARARRIVAGVPEEFEKAKDDLVDTSIVPDLVDEIGRQFARLIALMVRPSEAAVGATVAAFRGTEAIVDGMARQEEVLDQFRQAADQLGGAFQRAFEAAILEGKDLSDVLRQLAVDILDIAIAAAQSPLENLLGGLFKGPDPNDLVRVLIPEVPNPFTPAGFLSAGLIPLQHGGPLKANQPALVGEKGPELFVPKTGGTVFPNDIFEGMRAGGGGSLRLAEGGLRPAEGGGVQVNQQLVFALGVQDTVRAEVLNLMPAIINQTKAAVADGVQRGGTFRKAVRG